ncbi:histone H3.2 [Calliopsis andreniformis]|uniref:histone H3.2 n=1 Tax=Calliopsis andreniformis TaxID=337506 RepID=UPI003FCE978C
MARINQYDKIKKKAKQRSTDKTIHEIRYYQNSTKLLIPKKPFEQLVREIAQNLQKKK